MSKLPIAEFLEARLKEFDPKFEVRNGTAFQKLFFQPMQFIMQPLRDEVNDIQTSQSIRRILQTDDPDSFNEEAVDDLISNFFVDRRPGSISSGVARIYYSQPVDREYAEGSAVFTGNNSKTYVNPAPFSILRIQMSAQIEDGQYYFDIPIVSEETGEETELDRGELISIANDPDAISVVNKAAIVGGLTREKNTEYIERSKNSIAVRDLVAGKGFNATLYENFSGFIKELRPIGFGDQEMMRDILFNTHVGGKIDGYFCAPKIQQGSSDFIGLLIDTTRQARTTTNVTLTALDWGDLRNPNIDRSGGLDPIVMQVKSKVAAIYTCPVDLTIPIDLTGAERIKMTLDGVTKEFRIAGISTAATSRNEIVALINKSFGLKHATPFGNTFKIKSLKPGIESEIIITHPDIGNSAFSVLFDTVNPAPIELYGDGPITFLEGVHYEVDDFNGQIRRIVPSPIISAGSGVANGTTLFTSLSLFTTTVVNDMLTFNNIDYRILEVLDSDNIIVDAIIPALNDSFTIRRTGIKSGEVVYVEYYFNPISIDIGNKVKLDPDGKTRGIRPGREAHTISDLAFLRIISIEIIDPLTREPTGEFLNGKGGYGIGGFGRGPFGIGSSADYRLVVNSPHERFSVFEDSFIVFNSGLAGLSVRVSYDYSPEIVTLHDFVRSERERILDGDILMKHFLPAYVTGTIKYGIDTTDSSIPSNEDLQVLVREFISNVKAGQRLDFSDITQFIARMTDPFDKYGSYIKNFELKAIIYNTDGSNTIISGTENMMLPTLDPFPKETNRPQSARIMHWFAGDDLILERIEE